VLRGCIDDLEADHRTRWSRWKPTSLLLLATCASAWRPRLEASDIELTLAGMRPAAADLG